MSEEQATWPTLPLEAWKETAATLHLWMQIVGKIRLERMPWINHSWHVPLYVTARGMTTSPMPHGDRTFQIDFDFIDHLLLIEASDGTIRKMALRARSVADFYLELTTILADMGLGVRIQTMPNEIAECIPFEKDQAHKSYDPEYAHRFWRVTAQADRVFKIFRARFTGKCSPVHFFWGSFDLAVTRFSGRAAPEHAGGVPHLADWVVREAYSREVSSCGFWPGGEPTPFPLFYSYAYPEPPGYASAAVRPAGAQYHPVLREFILPYERVREAASPDEVLLDFLQSTYEATADLGQWDRGALEWEGPARIENSLTGAATV
jgi:hypothetical protein